MRQLTPAQKMGFPLGMYYVVSGVEKIELFTGPYDYLSIAVGVVNSYTGKGLWVMNSQGHKLDKNKYQNSEGEAWIAS